MTRAPRAEAISRVPSVEPASTTRTSLTRNAGMSSRTRAIEPASLYVGMTTLTRILVGLPQAVPRIAAQEHGIHAPGASASCPRHGEGDDDVHRQLPGPGCAELRDPEAEQEHPCGRRHHPHGDAGDQE